MKGEVLLTMPLIELSGRKANNGGKFFQKMGKVAKNCKVNPQTLHHPEIALKMHSLLVLEDWLGNGALDFD